MSEKYFKARLYFTGVVTVAIWCLLIWDHYHGGVPGHHILARADMPEISNWWGGLLLPLLTWFLSFRVHKRIIKNDVYASGFPANIFYGFFAALIFGIVLSTFFTLGNTEMPGYMLTGLLLTAPFLPVYRAECLLGFVIGMTFTFGAVLPTLAGSILALLSAVLYLIVRPAILFVVAQGRAYLSS